MTKVYVTDNVYTSSVADVVYTVEVASAASDTTVTTSGSGDSLIKSSAGGQHVLKSIDGGANVTITDNGSGTLTIAATEDDISNNDTDDLSEGSTNLYYTDARVMTSLETVSGHVLPSADVTYDLGSASKQWKDIYVGPGSLYVNGQKLLSTETGIVNLTTDPSENLNVQAGGTITMLSTGAVTTMQDATVNLGPADNSGTINARGDLNVIGNMDIDTADIGSLALSGIKISNTAGNIELETNATGYVHADAADLYVGPLAGAVKIDEGSITTTAGDLTISATGSVDVAGHNTTAEQATLTATAKTEAIASAESKDAVRATAANAYADAAVAVLTSGASSAFDTLVEIKTLMDAGDTTLTDSIAALNHDTLSGFVANEHIDWTTDQGSTNIHAGNYTDTNTTYTSSDFTHDDLTGFVANEHIDWTTDQGSTNIHAGNYTDTNTVYTDAEAISAVEGESTLDLTGTVTIGDLEFTNYSGGGEEFGKLKATGTNQNLCLQASNGTGYFIVNSPNQYFGAASGVKITNAYGTDTTLSGFGDAGEELKITGDLSGNLTANATTENLTTKNVKANPSSLTIPAAGNYWGWDYSADTGHALVGIGKFMTGHPIVGITQTDAVAESQPKAMFLVNHMDYDHSGEGDDLGGHGVSVDFNVQDEAGNLHQLGQNLVKLRNVTTGGSAGSSTITAYDAEYTLSVKASGTAGPTNSVTSNKDFTEVAEELRVVNKPVNSGNTDLSGLYLKYEGAETGTPSGKIKLRNKDTDTDTDLIALTEAKVSFEKVVNLASNTTTEQNALTGVAGDMIFNSTTSKFMGHNGSAWVELG